MQVPTTAPMYQSEPWTTTTALAAVFNNAELDIVPLSPQELQKLFEDPTPLFSTLSELDNGEFSSTRANNAGMHSALMPPPLTMEDMDIITVDINGNNVDHNAAHRHDQSAAMTYIMPYSEQGGLVSDDHDGGGGGDAMDTTTDDNEGDDEEEFMPLTLQHQLQLQPQPRPPQPQPRASVASSIQVPAGNNGGTITVCVAHHQCKKRHTRGTEKQHTITLRGLFDPNHTNNQRNVLPDRKQETQVVLECIEFHTANASAATGNNRGAAFRGPVFRLQFRALLAHTRGAVTLLDINPSAEKIRLGMDRSSCMCLRVVGWTSAAGRDIWQDEAEAGMFNLGRNTLYVVLDGGRKMDDVLQWF